MSSYMITTFYVESNRIFSFDYRVYNSLAHSRNVNCQVSFQRTRYTILCNEVRLRFSFVFPLTISELVELLTELLIRFIAFFLTVTTSDSSYFSRHCAREPTYFSKIPKTLYIYIYVFR